MTIKRILITITFFFAVFLNVSTLKLNASEEAKSYFVDGVNMTRWADTAMVYIGIDNTGQNQWGHNIVVNAEGQVTSIIQAGDGLGINLPVPEGGMIVSATGNRVQWLKDNVEVGDYALFDSISSRVLFSKTNDFSPFFSGKNISINAVNGIRNADTVVIYNISGSRTGTNAYGYEIMVNKNGYVEAVGGNNNLVPQGGYVISAIGKSNIDFLKMYGVIGAKATVTSFTKLTLVYDEESLQKSFEIKLNLLSDKLNTALKNFWILPYAELEAEIQEYRDIQIPSNMGILDRNKLLEEIDTINYKIAEEVPVETRGIWHETKETTVEQVKKVVADIKEAGLNQLNLGISNGYRTIFPVPSNFPFKQNPLLYGADLLRAYVDETKSAGIELVLSLPIYYNPAGDETTRPQWLSKANQSPSEESAFFSPANDEFKEYILSYIKYIFENYEIDGFQLDYIRYPQSYSG